MGELGKWADENSTLLIDGRKVLRLADGEPTELVLKAFKIVQNSFKKEEEVVRYLFELPNGEERIFDSQSTRLARALDAFQPGDRVTITKTGDGFDTVYKVERPTKSLSPRRVVEDETVEPSDIPF